MISKGNGELLIASYSVHFIHGLFETHHRTKYTQSKRASERANECLNIIILSISFCLVHFVYFFFFFALLHVYRLIDIIKSEIIISFCLHYSSCAHCIKLLPCTHLFRILFWYWFYFVVLSPPPLSLSLLIRIGFEEFWKKPNKNENGIITKGKRKTREKIIYNTNNCCSMQKTVKRVNVKNKMNRNRKRKLKIERKKTKKDE